jgi:hypothetical protein
MRKVTIIILIVLIVGFIGGVFYLDRKQESETGYRDGLKMGYLYGFNDAKAGTPLKTDKLGERFVIEGNSTYDEALLRGAKEGYVKGYGAGKETE